MITNKEITVAQIANLDSSGMCYVIHLSDGSFIIIDGGEADALGEGIYDYNSSALIKHLKKLSGEQKPVISAWFITHFHLDHIDLATRFIKEQGDNLEIKAFFYNSPGRYGEIDENERFALWEEAMECHPEAVRYVLKTGEILDFAGARVKVLMAEDFRYFADPPSQNHICAALMMSFDSGKKLAFLGDCDTERLNQLMVEGSAVYCTHEELKCDILQVPHHGLPLGSKVFIDKQLELYKVMEPQICFFPVDKVRYETDKKFFDNPFFSDNYYLLTTRKDKCFHSSQTVVVSLPSLDVRFE